MTILATGTGTIILVSIVFFLIVILLLVSLLLYARKKLLPQGKVKITINDEKYWKLIPDQLLLNTLSNNKIFLPSACGGGGTCTMCKAQVLDGEVLSCLPKRAILPAKKYRITFVWDAR